MSKSDFILIVGLVLFAMLPNHHANGQAIKAGGAERGDLASATNSLIEWRELPALPEPSGLAGLFAGVSNGAMIVAGGANFPDGMPWDGGKKIVHDTIFVLETPGGKWKIAGKFTHPLAYGVSVTSPRGLICIGGNDLNRNYTDVFLLEWISGKIRRTDLPALPRPISAACGALIGSTIYIAGGSPQVDEMAGASLRTFFAMDISAPAPAWSSLPPWPGRGRFLAVAGVQDESFFLISGMCRVAATGKESARLDYLTDAYRYRPSNRNEGVWQRIADLPRPNAAAPSPALALGPSHLLLLGGGADGANLDVPMKEYPGFSRDCLGYDTITDTWAVLASTPAPRVNTPVVQWNGRVVIPSGEMRPAVRSPNIWSGLIVSTRKSFGWANYLTLVLYLVAMVGIGVYCSTKNKSTDDFFRGGQRIPWWAAGLSIFATMISSITFMAVPATSYTGGWNYFLAPSYILLTPLVIYFYLPFYRRLNVTSAYEYLEKRFNLPTRMLGSGLFISFHLSKNTIVVYLPALALATVSNFNVYTCIMVMGLLCIVYTVMGGMEGVIWTDVVQAVILSTGAIVSIVVIATRVDGGVAGIFHAAVEGKKFFETVDWHWSYTRPTAWVILFGCFFVDLLPYTSSQDVVQRYMATKDGKTAARALWTNAAVTLPLSALFFAIGTALYAFYRSHPTHLDPTLPDDAIFPEFIVHEIPVGLAGLIVAGIFAAAQGNLSSGLNSMATAYVTDFHRRLLPETSDAKCLQIARIATIFFGVAGTLAALALATFNVQSLYLAFLQVLALLGGALSGLFVVGIFTRRTTGAGALVGVVMGTVATFAAKYFTDINFYLFSMIGVVSCIATAYFSSFVLPGRRHHAERDLEGLTIYDSVPKMRTWPGGLVAASVAE